MLLVANTEGNSDLEEDAIAMMLEHKVRGILYSTWFHRADRRSRKHCARPTSCSSNCFSPDPERPRRRPRRSPGRTVRDGNPAARAATGASPSSTPRSPPPPRTDGSKGTEKHWRLPEFAFDPHLVMEAYPDQEGGYGAAEELLKRNVTAVFCYNDRMAMGLYDGLREHGLSIPDDIAVVGFDNQEVIAAHLRPPLSTVALPHYELGAAGVRMLLGLDEAPIDSAVKIACPTIERASVAVHSPA